MGQYAPEFQLRLRSHAVPMNMSTKFTCSVRSRPDARISWSTNDVPIENSDKYTVSCMAGVATLTIHKCTGGDIGTYRCTAKNAVGEVSDYAQLDVIGASQGYSSKSNVLKNSTFTLRDYELDYWTREQKVADDLASVRSGSSSLASMKKNSDAPYFVRKPKDGETVNESVRIMISSHGNQHRLEISNVRFEDSGIYKVYADNCHGRSTACFRLDVNAKRRGSRAASQVSNAESSGPRIITDLKAKMQLGGILKLECSVLNANSVSEAVWYKDNVKVRSNDSKMSFGERMGNYFLEVLDLDRFDAGVYACHLVGSYGGQSTTQLTLSSNDIRNYQSNSNKCKSAAASQYSAMQRSLPQSSRMSVASDDFAMQQEITMTQEMSFQQTTSMSY